MALTNAAMKVLAPYLEDTEANGQQEIGMRCPLHNDTKRSASVNTEQSVWFCNACDVGGTVRELVKIIQEGGAINDGGPKREKRKPKRPTGPFPYTEDQVKAWHAALLSGGAILEDFKARRGLESEILIEFQIGWDSKNNAYTIPVRDYHGELANIRWYQLDPADDRRKIWGVTGYNEPVLFPIDELTEGKEVVICEGEWDALTLIQAGLPAITRTGAAKVWKDEWSPLFNGLDVFICHDADDAGQVGNRKVLRSIQGNSTANTAQVVHLPYETTEKHGKDVSDFFMEGGTKEEFYALMRASVVAPVVQETQDIRVIDSFDSSRFGETMRMKVTVTGKRNPPYMVPDQIEMSCGMDAGPKCKACPMMSNSGILNKQVHPNDPMILGMLDAATDTVATLIRESLDIVKCNRLYVDVQSHQTVEEIFVRPNVDMQLSTNDAGDYTTRRVFVVGPHDTLPNTTVEIIGGTHPNPKSQKNEFLAWSCTKVETSIDKFEMTPELVARLSVFRPERGDPVLHKLEEISDDFAHNITKIYGRVSLHMFMDLIFHSGLSFDFMGQHIYRGWLDGIVVGDTRTGKSEIAERLTRDVYKLGEMLSCESASFAGLVGGLTQLSNNAWEVTWGSVPLQDRRIVVMDEVSGLTPENIAQMSSIRSSGEAQLTKIRSEKTYARTRLLWLGNPRNAKMADYTYGVQSIRPLVGNNEDVARFDLAMVVQSGEVDAEEINASHHAEVEHVYTSELCHDLLLWVWSRSPEQIKWGAGAEQLVLDLAIKLGADFTEDPPLVQAANVRIKLARVAVAVAGRVFSSDKTGECLVVTKAHVQAAYDFLMSLYQSGLFGYQDLSREQLIDNNIAASYITEVEETLDGMPMLAKFLRSSSKFKRGDLEDVLNMGRDESSSIIQEFWERRMFRRDGPYMKCTPVLQTILRSMAP